MQRGEALALVGTLQAAFPAGNIGRATVELYAHKLEAYDATHVARAVDAMITERTDAFFPTWAEINAVLNAMRPRPIALPEPEGVLPTPEQRAIIDRFMQAGEKRSAELQRGVRLRYDETRETA